MFAFSVCFVTEFTHFFTLLPIGCNVTNIQNFYFYKGFLLKWCGYRERKHKPSSRFLADINRYVSLSKSPIVNLGNF